MSDKMATLFNFLSQISNPFLDTVFNIITSSYLLIPLIVCAILLVEENKRNNLNKRSAILIILPIFLAVLLATLTTTVIKEVVKEDRPCKVIHDVNFPFCKDSNSFPSRHTAIAFSTLPFLAPFLASRGKYFILLLVYATIVGVGMIYLGQHYPHDVLAGFIIGFGIGYVFALKKESIAEKFRKI